jgi:hypothetical protein
MTRPENWRHPDMIAKAGESLPPNTPGPLSQARALRQQSSPRSYYVANSLAEDYIKRSPERVGTPPVGGYGGLPFSSGGGGYANLTTRHYIPGRPLNGTGAVMTTGGKIGGIFPYVVFEKG